MTSKYLGRVFIRANGESLASTPDSASLDPGGITRSEVMGDHGYLGYTEKMAPGVIECEIAVNANTSAQRIQAITDATITFEGDTGQVWVVRNAACAETVKIQNGKAKLKFIGSPAEEV